MSRKELLKQLPSVDEILKSAEGQAWEDRYPRRFVVEGIRQALDIWRRQILAGKTSDIPLAGLTEDMEAEIKSLSALSLKGLINATGIVMHTNLGRSPMSESALDNINAVARGYSNLEYDLQAGRRGKRYSHIKRLLSTVTGAEDGMAVNNNAGAVLLCLSALARGREVIVSRGELVEIGGSFRIPEVMAQSGAKLVEVGATNKTHLRDYEAAITEDTALLLKVHQSNFRMEGFWQEVPIAELSELGNRHRVPVMFDLGSGSLVDLRPLGIHDEPTVQEVVASGPDIVTFSGDKLLGGPQAGLIVGSSSHMEAIAAHPLTRALRIDKLTLAALESTLMDYADLERAPERIPALAMLLAPIDDIKRRAANLARTIGRFTKKVKAKVQPDFTFSGGGALPAKRLETSVVVITSKTLSPNQLEEKLRKGDTPVIGRIKEDALVLDCRTIMDGEVPTVARAIKAAVE
jgi:L-seryl-tRNA(Ser) seleniumtransferase